MIEQKTAIRHKEYEAIKPKLARIHLGLKGTDAKAQNQY